MSLPKSSWSEEWHDRTQALRKVMRWERTSWEQAIQLVKKWDSPTLDTRVEYGSPEFNRRCDLINSDNGYAVYKMIKIKC